MSRKEEHCNPANINSSSTRTRPIPPITPPREYALRDGTEVVVRNAIRIDPDRDDLILGKDGQPEGNEHFYLCKTLCKTGRYTKSFDGLMFSREEYYLRSLIRVAVVKGEPGGRDGHGILGFSNFWHKVRTDATKLYFIVVDPRHHRRSVAEVLMDDLYSVCKHRVLELDVNKTNPEAIKLYEKHGFKVEGDSLHGTCHYMVRRWTEEGVIL